MRAQLKYHCISGESMNINVSLIVWVRWISFSRAATESAPEVVQNGRRPACCYRPETEFLSAVALPRAIGIIAVRQKQRCERTRSAYIHGWTESFGCRRRAFRSVENNKLLLLTMKRRNAPHCRKLLWTASVIHARIHSVPTQLVRRGYRWVLGFSRCSRLATAPVICWQHSGKAVSLLCTFEPIEEPVF